MFGPFTKVIKLNAANLMVWLLFTSLLVLLSSNYLTILLSEESGCVGVFECAKPLMEGAVGRALFDKMAGNWAAILSYSCFTIVLAAVLMNMVVAQMNSTYTKVSKQSTLHYYKDLFDLRYIYKLDPKYGYLAALEHPFVIFLLPSLCVVKCIERRSRREQQRARAGHFLQEGSLYRLNFSQISNSRSKWRCCLCFQCRKVNPRKSMQLEDFNHAMLRLIYALHLAFFTAAAFFLGIVLTPVGYFAVIVSKCRLLYKM